MDKILATTVYDEKLKAWIIYVNLDEKFFPVGATINESLGLFEYYKFNSKEKAIAWINSKPNKFKYDEKLIVK